MSGPFGGRGRQKSCSCLGRAKAIDSSREPMLHSPSLRRTLLAVLVLASVLEARCRYRPADAWRIYAYRGRDIRDFLTTGPTPVAILEGPEGEGRTYIFEYLRV